MADTHKYYWLKLKRDFFKRHDIRIVESLENGKDYLLFYMKLLVESIDHEGYLRFSETIPYDEKMLSTITDTNIDVVRSACKLFGELGMMEWEDDGTLFMNQVQGMIGSETSDAIRKRDYREKAKQIIAPKEQEGHCPDLSQKRAPELELDIEKEIDTDTHTEAPEVSVGVLESIKHPSNLPKLIYDKWQAIPGVTKDCDYMYWIQREWREIARAIEGFHSDIVLNSLDNYKKERDNPNTWMTAKVSSRQFFTGGLFETCRGATDVKKQVPRCKACTCQLLPDGVPNAGTCQNDECDMYHRRQE
ncbi:phage replisome organizer N-terminal domain-containing protein [Candidatus Pacearchaeota archaeon]|jgi:predicted phage replisome organizer|nr:phage replisome organizer N-terminal domain-containing protein [Candidatus Pacearchaeota archaeon]